MKPTAGIAGCSTPDQRPSEELEASATEDELSCRNGRRQRKSRDSQREHSLN
jgi:hypothetical protein